MIIDTIYLIPSISESRTVITNPGNPPILVQQVLLDRVGMLAHNT